MKPLPISFDTFFQETKACTHQENTFKRGNGHALRTHFKRPNSLLTAKVSKIYIQYYKDDIVFHNQHMAAATLETKTLSYKVYPVYQVIRGRISFSYKQNKLPSILLNQAYTYEITVFVEQMLTFIPFHLNKTKKQESTVIKCCSKAYHLLLLPPPLPHRYRLAPPDRNTLNQSAS